MVVVIGATKVAIKIKMKLPDEASQTEQEAQQKNLQDDIIAANSGCGFNVAKALASMGRDVAFISTVGNDSMGLAAIAELDASGVNVEGINSVPGITPISVEMFNILGDAELSRSNDVLTESITPQAIIENEGLMQKAQVILLDGALPKETIEYVAKEYAGRENVKIFFDPASVPGGLKVKGILNKLHAVMPGRMEAEAMTDKTILSEEQLMEAGAYFHQNGIAKTIITMKGGGLYYKEGMSEGILRPERVLTFAGTSGAGDVLSAAVIDATLDGKSIEEISKYAMSKAADFLAGRTDERPAMYVEESKEE